MRTHMRTNIQLLCALSAFVSVAVPVLSQTTRFNPGSGAAAPGA